QVLTKGKGHNAGNDFSIYFITQFFAWRTRRRIVPPARPRRITRCQWIVRYVGIQIALPTGQLKRVWVQETALGARVEPRPHEVQSVRLCHDAELTNKLERVGDGAGRGEGSTKGKITIEILIGTRRPGQAHRGTNGIEIVVVGGGRAAGGDTAGQADAISIVSDEAAGGAVLSDDIAQARRIDDVARGLAVLRHRRQVAER